LFLAEIQGLALLVLIFCLVLLTIKLFYNPKSEKASTTSDKLKDFERFQKESKEQDNEIEEIVKYITDSDITSVRTNVIQKEVIDTLKKMYQDGLKKGQNPHDIIEEIADFNLTYLDYIHELEMVIIKLREYPFTTDTYFDDEETDVEKIRRPSIPQNIKDKVWNRDDGKCVQCGSNENIEFDHIIPFSKGGSSTYRNLQILCEKCNRSKSDKIG
jgi:hypothetical protein